MTPAAIEAAAANRHTSAQDSPAVADLSPSDPRNRNSRNSACATRRRDRRDTGHGMLNASHVANRWKVAARHVLMVLINKLPGSRFKSRLISRVFGVKMGRDVGLAYGVLLDPYDPSMISFGDNVIVGYETKIFVHAFTLNRQRIRPVTIGSNVMIGGFCVIAPGVTIGDGASIAPGTIVSRDVPAGAIVTGNEMRIRRRGAA